MRVSAEDNVETTGQAPMSCQALKDCGDAHAARADYARAQECYNQAARLGPDDPGPYVGLGHVFIHTGQLDKAERAFRIASRFRADCAEAYAGLAMIHQHRREYPAAFEMYLKCLELDGDDLVALLGLFQTSCRMGTFAKIIGYLERYLVGHPGDVPVLFCLGSLYAREGMLAQARDALRQVLRAEPAKAEAVGLLEEVQAAIARRRPGQPGRIAR